MRLLRVHLEALPELTHKVIDGADRSGRLAPDMGEQLIAAEHLVRVAHEEHEQLELEVRQLHLDAGAHDEPLAEVDHGVPERELIVAADRDGRGGDRSRYAAKHGLDAREEL